MDKTRFLFKNIVQETQRRKKMEELLPASRVEHPAQAQARYASINKPEDAPKRYREHPSFNDLVKDPAHHDKPNGKTVREAMSIIESELSHAVTGPVRRPEADNPYIDFYDGEGHPFDVKTPVSTSYDQNRGPFMPWVVSNSVTSQLAKTCHNALTGEQEPVCVLLDTSYLNQEDYEAMWRQLRMDTKDNPELLARVYEVNVQLDDNVPVKQRRSLNPARLAQTAAAMRAENAEKAPRPAEPVKAPLMRTLLNRLRGR